MMTLDRMIQKLEELRKEYGGDIRVCVYDADRDKYEKAQPIFFEHSKEEIENGAPKTCILIF